jgi:hypothetical protein
MHISEHAVVLAVNAYWNALRKRSGSPVETKLFKPDPEFAKLMREALEAALPEIIKT